MDLSSSENAFEEDSSLHGGVQGGHTREGGRGIRKRYSNDKSRPPPTFGDDHSQNKKRKISEQVSEIATTHLRRLGTSSIAGQLYEVKTATLALLNALLASRRGDVDHFWLGTNVDGIGAVDDVVLKYTTHGRERVIFVQCKHRDNLEKKVYLNDVLKEDGDFGIIKYLDSYLSIIQKSDKGDDIVLKDIDENTEILIYTSAETLLGDVAEQVEVDKNDFFFTKETGRIFKFKENGEHIIKLLDMISNRHTKQLAKLLADCILSEKENELMTNNLIKMFHVYLRNHVLKVSDSKFIFHSDFFKNEDFFVSRFRKYLYDEMFICKKACKITKVSFNDVESILKTRLLELPSDKINTLINKSDQNKLFLSELRYNLNRHAASLVVDSISTDIITKNLEKMQPITVPSIFGSIDLKIIDEMKLDRLSKQFIKILQDHEITSIDGKVRITSKHIGYKKLLTKEDVQINGGIGGLVGNLLILDAETNLLKLDTYESSLPANAKKVLIKMKDIIKKEGLNIDLSRYRFQFNIPAFPRLSWNDEADRTLLTDFISNFKFYSSQLKEDSMDNTIKKKMIKFYNTDFNIHKTFLEVLHKLQSWWEKKDEEIYLTETCNYFNDPVKPDILLTFKFIYTKEINSQDIEFSATALQSLGIENFLKHIQDQILNIITNNLTLSTIKVLQYFTTNDTLRYNFSIIDMKYIHEYNLYNEMLEKLQNTQIENIIIKSAEIDENLYSLCKRFSNINKKYFIITEKKFSEIPNYIQDETNTFLDLSQESQTKLLENTRILFQEEEIKLKELIINEKCQSLINANVLDEIISKEHIALGKPLADEKYNTIKHFYIDRKLHRCVNIKKEFIMDDSQLNDKEMKNVIIAYSKRINKPIVEQCQDILLISDDIEDFEKLCTEHRNSIHWFQKKNKHYSWKQSRGSLNNLRDYVDRDETSGEHRSLNTMTDVEDKTVIIVAGPGMGKTSLLTHLSIATKKLYPSTWIVRINLLDHSDCFWNWKKNNVNVDKEEAFRFLTKMIMSTDSETPLSIFENRLFDQYYRSGKVALIFDGYDEISPEYKYQVIELLIHFNTNIIKMWVATRPYDIRRELENKLDAFYYTLVPLTQVDQTDFLIRYGWNHSTLAHIFRYPDMETILATPLLLYIIVKVGQISDLHNLYRRFIDIKVNEIYIPEKSKLSNKSNPNQRRLIVKECKDIISNHKILAIAAMFHRDELSRVLNEQEKEKLYELIKRIDNGKEETGIVERVVDGTPRFIHRTFAEYFVVEYICDKLKSGKVFDIICKLLLNNHSIRKFFDSKIANDCCLLELDINRSLYEKILEYSYDENRLLMIIAMQENLKHVVRFYSKVVNNYLRESNLRIHTIIHFSERYQLFENAFKHGHVSFVSDMLDTPVFENPQQQITGRLELLAHIVGYAIKCLKYYQLIADFTFILDKIIRKGYQLDEFFSQPTVHCEWLRKHFLGDYFHILLSCLAKLSDEQLVRVATVSINHKWTQAHVLNKMQIYEVLHYLMKRLDKTRFRTFCLTANDYKEQPMHLLFLKLIEDENLVKDYDYSTLCEYICPSEAEDKAEFDENILRNMYVIAATCKSLFNGNATWFIRRMLDEVQHYCRSTNWNDVNFGVELLCNAAASDNDIIIHPLLHNVKDADLIMKIMMMKCYNNLTIFENLMRLGVNIDFLPLELLSIKQLMRLASKAKSFNVLDKHLNRLSPNQLVKVLTCAGDRTWTIMHEAAKTQDFTKRDPFTYHLGRLSIKQLFKIATVADSYRKTPAHEAARAQNFTFFYYFKQRLNNKNYFRKICFPKKNNSVTTSIIIEFTDKSAEKYLSLCEYICPSNDEPEKEFDDISLRSMYPLAVTCKPLFNLNTSWFVSKMLKEIKHYWNSGYLYDYDSDLLLLAISHNNEIVIETLLEDVTDVDCFMNIFSSFFNRPSTITSSYITVEHMIVLFNFLKERLNKNDFREGCFKEMRILRLFTNIDKINDMNLYVAGYLPLCEYICPSSDEDETEFDEITLHKMYLLAATCNTLFTLNTRWFISKMLEEVTSNIMLINGTYENSHEIIWYAIECKNEDFLRALFQNIVDTDRIVEIIPRRYLKSFDDINLICHIKGPLLHHAINYNISCQVLRLDQLSPEQLLRVAETVDTDSETSLCVAVRRKHLDFVYLLKNRLDRRTFRGLCLNFNKEKKTILHMLCDKMRKEADDDWIRACVPLCEYVFPTDEEDVDHIDEEYLHYMCMIVAEYGQLFTKLRDSWFVKNMLDKVNKHCMDSEGIGYHTSVLYIYTARRSGNKALLREVRAPYTLQCIFDEHSTPV